MRSVLTKIFGDTSEKAIKALLPTVEDINQLEPEMQALSDDELASLGGEFRTRHRNGESLDDLLSEVFAATREAAARKLNKRHYDVQLIGGIVLHQGKIAEMKTGEGKTQTATLAVALNAITGRGVHLITVNDSPARREAGGMGQIITRSASRLDVSSTSQRLSTIPSGNRK